MHHLLRLDEIDRTRVDLVGGKAARLGELTRLDGFDVPDGFCVTTQAYRRVAAPPVDPLLEELARLGPADHDALGALCARIRATLTTVPIPPDLAADIGAAVGRLGDGVPCAVRSSATAEDLPTASFAGQHDSFLHVVGPAAVLDHVRRCWASLFTERAVTYRRRHGFDHRRVQMAVVVQRMVAADAAGVLFTADPVTGNRTVATVEAVAGLGEALVSGLVTPHAYTVRDGAVTAAGVAVAPLLTEAQVLRLAALGRRIEAHVGHPQDVEWCLAGGAFRIVQSRSITTLFPVPETPDGGPHVYLSVGHQQMMTDAMKPLGLSFWQLTTPAPMAEAGSRLFVDVTARLTSRATRDPLLELMGRSDPLMRDALQTVLDRGFLPPAPPGETTNASPARPPTAAPEPTTTPGAADPDPALVTALIAANRASVAALARDIEPLSGAALLAFIRADLQELRRILFDPQGLRLITAATEATWWLNDQLATWLGEPNAADPLAQSVEHNVTSEMGLRLLEVADAVRPHPEVVAFLRQVEAAGRAGSTDTLAGPDVLDGLAGLEGGPAARAAVQAFLAEFGVRGVGEIDLTRPRWSERPATLVPAILGHVDHAEPGAGARRVEQGRQRADATRTRLLERVRALPDGERHAVEVARRIDLVRTFTGYREYPKYGMVARYALYRRALLREAERLVRAGALREADDLYFLRFDELEQAVRTGRADPELVRRRRDEFRAHEALRPPRVLTSDGEAVHGAYRAGDLPPGALPGLPVSAGTVEGRARVVLDLAEADLAPGDILVTAFTDPSWTPLFLAVGGLVTEVGGQMTHGSVIAREYGLPAVVGVVDATRLIRDGRRIRVHGTTGYVELLE